LPDSAIRSLTEVAAGSTRYSTRVATLEAIARSTPSALLVGVLMERPTDEDNDVRRAAANGLASVGARHVQWRDPIRKALAAAVRSADFATLDRHEHRAGQDYAYDGLWRLAELVSNAAKSEA
jgi:HEAT repeat protein